MDGYLEQCGKLSLTARLAIALLIFERFCKENKLISKHINDFSEYLWESQPTELVCYGLGDDPTEEILFILKATDIDEPKFRLIIQSVIEILWSSFWGAPQDEMSIESLDQVIRQSQLTNFPPLHLFEVSIFSEGNGWGKPISQKKWQIWRNCYSDPHII